MKYILKPSLEHIALVKIVVTLWNQNNIKYLLIELCLLNRFLGEHDSEWKNVENKVMEKVSHLSLPRISKKKIMSFIKPIGLQILKWIKYHCINGYLHIDLPYEFSWTPEGIIDKKKTAEMLIKDESLCICKRYKLACIYCLENDILELWEKIPGNLKEYFLLLGNPTACQKYLLSHWTNTIFGLDNDNFSYKDAFQFCAKGGEKDAAEYFLQKLTPNEKEATLVTTAKMASNAEVLHVLFSQMGKDQQIDIFKSKPYQVLYCFLIWPLQRFFIEVANCMWEFLPKDVFGGLLQLILDKIKYGYKDYKYKKLFENFWKESPDVFKSYIVDGGRFLQYLFHLGDTKILKLFLQNINVTEKKKIIYCEHEQHICEEIVFMLSEEKLDLLKIFIQQCLPLESEMVIFKKEFEKHIVSSFWKDHFTMNKHKWDELFPLCDISIRQ